MIRMSRMPSPDEPELVRPQIELESIALAATSETAP